MAGKGFYQHGVDGGQLPIFLSESFFKAVVFGISFKGFEISCVMEILVILGEVVVGGCGRGEVVRVEKGQDGVCCGGKYGFFFGRGSVEEPVLITLTPKIHNNITSQTIICFQRKINHVSLIFSLLAVSVSIIIISVVDEGKLIWIWQVLKQISLLLPIKHALVGPPEYRSEVFLFILAVGLARLGGELAGGEGVGVEFAEEGPCGLWLSRCGLLSVVVDDEEGVHLTTIR